YQTTSKATPCFAHHQLQSNSKKPAKASCSHSIFLGRLDVLFIQGLNSICFLGCQLGT
uniref:Uncharacterized protein n=1 Tax=Magallana gigas TaxID=29159 RepID=A0A8W8MYS1_MAGGI